ncbi:MAG: hypothetical protein AB1567_08425 [bacterium]
MRASIEIKKEIWERFKKICKSQGVLLTIGFQQAIIDWIKSRKSNKEG